ncbi:MAG TPA: 50S ribosomal protein L21 [Polyangiaceae bacterium]|jgi:large subunit ribosomal protein L21|nr:50S ribosomal protein L21 [Polyangiaceae bacterium]
MSSAIIRNGGQQFRVSAGDVLHLASIQGDAGQDVVFDEVLALLGDSTTLGQPLVKGAKVTAQIVRHLRGEKLIVFKFRRRKRYKRKNGHRQNLTEVKITGISA